MARVWRGAFTCVGWQVTLCDLIWQVTSRSSEIGFPGRAISAFFIFTLKKRGANSSVEQSKDSERLGCGSVVHSTHIYGVRSRLLCMRLDSARRCLPARASDINQTSIVPAAVPGTRASRIFVGNAERARPPLPPRRERGYTRTCTRPSVYRRP